MNQIDQIRSERMNAATRAKVCEAVEVAIEMGGGPATVSARFAPGMMEAGFGPLPASS